MARISLVSTKGRLLLGILAIVCLSVSYHLMENGLGRLAEARQMERLPATPLGALTQGPYLIEGTVTDTLGTQATPYSGTEAVYYRYQLQEEYRDSDGDKRTRTLESGGWRDAFELTDHSGTAVVNPVANGETIEWNVHRTYRHRKGELIYSEWALRPGDTPTVIGHYRSDQQQLIFEDLSEFSLPALISTEAVDIEGGDRMFGAGIRISIATGLLALGLALALTMLKIHRLWVYVVAMTLVVSGTLSWLGVSRLNQEWSAIAELYEGRYTQLNQADASPLLAADVAALEQLIRRSTSGWLDQRMFQTIVAQRLPAPELDASTSALAQELVDSKPVGRIKHGWLGILLAVGGAALAAFLMLMAVRAVKLKRLIEAVPTSSSLGLSFGLSELKGRVESDDQYPPLQAPLTDQKCVAFHYKVEEKSGSGKNRSWRTVESRTENTPFWLQDDEGRVLVYPEGATVEYPKVHSETKGNRRYTVRFLDTITNIYCLGFAGLDKQRPDHLSIQQDPGSPFLISAKEEDHLVLSRGARGFIGIAVSLGLSLFTATTLLVADGSFSPDNLLISALVVPLVLCLYIGILHYNDIVFLKNRVRRARANIDTVLQQRHDLWPALENTVKAAMAHEKQLMTRIAQLRAAPIASMDSTTAVERTIQQEQAATQALQARIEDYPEMKNHEVVKQFMAIMAQTENYLSLLRNSYTDSALIYNTRIQTLPDLLLAWLFRFKPASQFQKEVNPG